MYGGNFRIHWIGMVVVLVLVLLVAPDGATAGDTPMQDTFLLGWYDREGRIENLSRFGKTHVDVVIPYGAKYYDGARAVRYLDEAHRHNVRVVVDLYIKPEWNIPFSQLTEIAKATKGHPALIGNYLMDEPRYALRSAFGRDTARKVEYVTEVRDAIRAGNPDAPIWIVFAHRVEPEYRDLYDVLMVDHYPGWTDPLEPVFHRYVRLSWRRWKDASDYAKEHNKPYYPVGLAFILPDNPGSPRPLTWEEMRYHFYTGVVADSDGFIFYAHHHAHHLDGHYQKMAERLFAQISPIGPAIRNGRMNDPRIGVSESPDTLVYRYGVDPATGNSALIAVNIARWDAADNDGQTLAGVRFTLPPGVRPASVTVDSEDRSLAVTDGAFTDDFAPFAVHIYTWGSPAASETPSEMHRASAASMNR